MSTTSVSFLGDFGPKLDENGYPFFPVTLRTKRPRKGQTDYLSRAHDPDYRRLICEGMPASNIGIPTGNGLAAADFDVLDLDLSKLLLRSFRESFGSILVRVGQRPKFLVPFRIDGRMQKGRLLFTQDVKKGKPIEHKIEFLGDGQSFVGYGLHPDGHEYRWLNDKCLLNTPRIELPLIHLVDLNDWIQTL